MPMRNAQWTMPNLRERYALSARSAPSARKSESPIEQSEQELANSPHHPHRWGETPSSPVQERQRPGSRDSRPTTAQESRLRAPSGNVILVEPTSLISTVVVRLISTSFLSSPAPAM